MKELISAGLPHLGYVATSAKAREVEDEGDKGEPDIEQVGEGEPEAEDSDDADDASKTTPLASDHIEPERVVWGGEQLVKVTCEWLQILGVTAQAHLVAISLFAFTVTHFGAKKKRFLTGGDEAARELMAILKEAKSLKDVMGIYASPRGSLMPR